MRKSYGAQFRSIEKTTMEKKRTLQRNLERSLKAAANDIFDVSLFAITREEELEFTQDYRDMSYVNNSRYA